MSTLPQLKQDEYRRSRGGKAAFFVISCAKCGEKILLYQKDDPRGTLKRMYFDRIIKPSRLAKLVSAPIKTVPVLVCASCKHLIGVPYVYPKERRKAFLVSIGDRKSVV